MGGDDPAAHRANGDQLPDFQRQVALGESAGDGASLAMNASHESLPAGVAIPLAAVGITAAVGVGYVFIRR